MENDPAPPSKSPPPILDPATPPPALPPLEVYGRLHPLTFLFVITRLIRQFLIPAIITLLVGADTFLGFALLLFMFLGLVQATLRYVTFSYRIQSGELVTRQGLMERTERHIPLDRVQDIRLEQGILHRMFSVFDLHIETAGGQGPEATLSVLSGAEAERLRTAILARTEAVPAQLPGPRTAPQVLACASIPDLIRAGLTSNQAASALVFVAAFIGSMENLLPESVAREYIERLSQAVAGWFRQSTDHLWLSLAAAAVPLILLGMLISVLGSIVLFFGFTLSRSGEDLHRTYGLFTRRSSNLPRCRIQVVKIDESWLRRLFRFAAIKATTAAPRPGDPSEQKEGRDVLFPILPRSQVESLLSEFLPNLGSNHAHWNSVARCAIRRSTVKSTLFLLALAAVLTIKDQDWRQLWPVVFIPAAYSIALQNYRRLGYRRDPAYFWTRRGWLGRATHIVPIDKVQSIIVRQTPFDRRWNVATLLVDTAGQAATAAAPAIDNVPFEEALSLARDLARQTSRS